MPPAPPSWCSDRRALGVRLRSINYHTPVAERPRLLARLREHGHTALAAAAEALWGAT